MVVEMLVGTSFIDRYECGFFRSVQRISLKNFRPVSNNAMRWEGKNPRHAIVKNVVCSETEIPNKDKGRVAREPVMRLRLASPVTAKGRLRLIKSTRLAQGREQVILASCKPKRFHYVLFMFQRQDSEKHPSPTLKCSSSLVSRRRQASTLHFIRRQHGRRSAIGRCINSG